MGEGSPRQNAAWRTEVHTYLLIVPHPQMCLCCLHPIIDLRNTFPSLQLWNGGPLALVFLCLQGDAEPVSAFPCLLLSLSQQVC